MRKNNPIVIFYPARKSVISGSFLFVNLRILILDFWRNVDNSLVTSAWLVG